MAAIQDDLSMNLEAGGVAPDVRPDTPVKDPVQWMKENLFSSVGNALLTGVFVAVLGGLLWWFVGLVFKDSNDWDAVATNIRLLFSFNYPAEQYIRVWFSLGMLLGAVSLTAAFFDINPSMSVRKLGINASGLGATSLIVGVLPATPSGARIVFLIIGALFLAAGVGTLQAVDEPHKKFVSFPTMLLTFGLSVVAFAWLVPIGRNEFANGAVIDEGGFANPSTKIPWTIMMAILVGVYFLARAVKPMLPVKPVQTFLITFWVAGPAFLIFLVLRDPTFDYDRVLKVDIPWAIGFAVVGGAILYWLTKPMLGEIGRLVAVALLGVAVLNWVAAFFGWWSMLQKTRVSFLVLALFALAAPTFAGEKSARVRYVGAWVAVVALGHWLITGINTTSTLDIAAPPFLGGFTISLVIFYYVMLVSFPLGAIMALARTSTLPIFRVMATVYIEFIRGIPLITVLFFFSSMVSLFLPNGMDLSELAAIFIGYTLFSAAYVAENIRGGLQSVRRGQFEASDALGLTTSQRTIFVVLPQALRVSIPNLVGQAIATFKETSLIFIVGAFDFLRVANVSIASQPDYLGQNLVGLLFVSAVYWVFAYSMSRASRSLETKLGVGSR